MVPIRVIPSSKSENKYLGIQDILKPVLMSASIIGLIPDSLKFLESKQIFKAIPKSIYVNFLIASAILSLLTTFFIIYIHYIFSHVEKNNIINEETTEINYSIELVIFLVVCYAAYINAFLNRSKYVKILNMIVVTWNSIRDSSRGQMILKKLRLQFIFMLFLLMIILITQIGLHIIGESTTRRKLMVGFTFNMPQAIQFNLHAVYTVLVVTASAILTNLKDEILEKERAFYPIIVKTKMNMSIRKIELIYMKVYEIKTEINNTFRAPLLVSVLQSFHALVSESHILYHGCFVDETLSGTDVVSGCIWILCQFIKVYSLSYSGSLLKCEAFKLGQILHSFPMERAELRQLLEIQHFSTMIQHQPLEISLYGFFSLDASFMFNMFASAATYLIILVQLG